MGRSKMEKIVRLAALMVMVTTMLSGCIVDPWYGWPGGHHHHHDRW